MQTQPIGVVMPPAAAGRTGVPLGPMGVAGRAGSPPAGTSTAGMLAASTAGVAGTIAAAGGGMAGGASADAGHAGTSAAAGGTPATSTPPISIGPLFPANGAKDVCPDPSLHLHFSGAPSVGNTGKISVFDLKSPASAVAVVDLAAASVMQTIGGVALKLTRPVYIDGNDVIIRLPRALEYGQSYYVTVDAGAIKAPGGTSMTITGASDWQFSTRAAAPSDLTALRVAVDGTGQFCSVQGAADALPKGAAKATITIGAGTYLELIHLASKNNVTFHGEDRKKTVIVGTNNENLNSGTAKRALWSIENSSGVIVENLTIHNLTAQGGSQAEALRLQGCDECVVRHADILSLQDTLLWSGKIYANDCYVEGNVDFVWGTGAVYFDTCELKTVGRAGPIVQSRNAAADYGYVFVDCKLTADAGITGNILARIDASVYPGSQVAFVNCQMGKHVAPAGWTVTNGSAGGSLRYWEYQSTDESGGMLDVSRRLAGSKQISADDAKKLRDPAQVLGGWTPPK
jgi:pectin methylesterase-like acyl-CoA thioesterase